MLAVSRSAYAEMIAQAYDCYPQEEQLAQPLCLVLAARAQGPLGVVAGPRRWVAGVRVAQHVERKLGVVRPAVHRPSLIQAIEQRR